VAGSGKTTVGRLVAARCSVPCVDADDFHPVANRIRMARGEALDDAARAVWLTALVAVLRAHAATGCVLACSALRQRYRDRLAESGVRPRFVHLQVSPAVLRARLARRQGHFFPAQLLDSQLATWEELVGGLVVDGEAPPDAVAAAVLQRLPR
jgi:gluconokinase